MDLSKLPKLSTTSEAHREVTAPAADTAPAAEAAPSLPPVVQVQYVPVPPSNSIGLAEAWVSIALGLLLLFLCPNTISYLRSPSAFAQDHSYWDEHNNPINYTQSGFFLQDLGATVFAVALILEGIALAALRKPKLLWIAFMVTVLSGLFNAFVIVATQASCGFPLICGFGVIVLGYMAFTQLRLIQALKLLKLKTS